MLFLRKSTILLLTFILTLSIGTEIFAQKALKKRIAVFDFEDKTDHRVRWWRGGQTVGHGMADMIVTALVKSGKYTVIERQELQKIMQEQKLGMSGAVTPESAAQVGKLLGVEVAVIGSVTEFGYSESKKGGSFGGIGGGVKTSKATVGLDIRLINTSTGEILAAENVRKNEKSRGVSFKKDDMSFEDQKKFDDSIVGKATRKAVEDVVKKVNKQMENVAWSGKVIMEKNGVIYINAGSKGGISIGDKFTVYRPGEELIDPDTGLNLGSEEMRVGRIQITDDIANGKASKAKALDGSGYRKGDIVREK